MLSLSLSLSPRIVGGLLGAGRGEEIWILDVFIESIKMCQLYYEALSLTT